MKTNLDVGAAVVVRAGGKSVLYEICEVAVVGRALRPLGERGGIVPTSREELLRMVRKLREHTGIDLDERGYNARWICRVCQQQSSANGGALLDITHAPDCAWYTPVD